MKIYKSIKMFEEQSLEKKIMIISENCDEIIKNFLVAKIGLENKKIVNFISQSLTDVSSKIIKMANVNSQDNTEDNKEFLSQKSSLIYTYLISMHQKVIDLTKYRDSWMFSDDEVIEAKPSPDVKAIDKVVVCEPRLCFFNNQRQFEAITMMEKKELIKDNILKLKAICSSMQDDVILGMLDDEFNKCKDLPDSLHNLNTPQMISTNSTYASIYEQTKLIYQVLADIAPLREGQTISKPTTSYKSGDAFFAKNNPNEISLPVICELKPTLSFES